MALVNVPSLQFTNSAVFGIRSETFVCFQKQSRSKCLKTYPCLIGIFVSRLKFWSPTWYGALQHLTLECLTKKPIVIEARTNNRKDSAKTRNRRMLKKFNGTPKRPRLSVFCSEKQLYAMLVDDQNKKRLFYGSTLQKSMRQTPSCTTVEAAQCVGEALVKACINLNINEISSYDRNGFSRGQRMQAFEIAISSYGFLPG